MAAIWLQNLLSVPTHLTVATDFSFLPCFSFLTRWLIQEGLHPDSVFSTLFSPPSFFLCLVGAGQFHLLHVSVSMLLVFSEACLSECVSLPSCFPSCSRVFWKHAHSPGLRGAIVNWSSSCQIFLNGGKNGVYSVLFCFVFPFRFFSFPFPFLSLSLPQI